MQRLMGSAHSTLASALLLWSLLLHAGWRAETRARWPWLLCAASLGLVRPFDLGLFVLVAGLFAAAELLWLSPVLFYDLLAYHLHPAFAVWSGSQNVVATPPAIEFGFALGVPCLLAVAGVRDALRRTGLAQAVLASLWMALLASLALMLSGASFALQFANSLGLLLLLLAAAGTPAAFAPVAAVLLAPTSLLLLFRFLNPAPQWFVARDTLAAIDAPARSCHADDVALAPPNLSLLISGRTACRVVVGPRVLTPDFAARETAVQRFYDAATTPAARRAYLASVGATRVVAPGGAGAWLGENPPFAPRLALSRIEAWERLP
jgi:hypothetical protein